ncbi:hypothetical protein B0I37DRAFT_417801 [Chaetomium sp. MPI-CAGE-AT-0009]|nr:hypothetical protein B0I37DRAFT_417801 [Chaetomium sp. MPI-CAGE-AT-0009]
MAFPTSPDFGDLQPLADLLTRASEPSQTALVARELAASASPVTASVGRGRYADLADRLSAAAEGAEAEVNKDRVPMPTDVAILPMKDDDNPLSDEAAQAFADIADSAFNVMKNPPLAGMYSFASGSGHTFSRRMSKTELHLSFLREIFQGFSLTDAAVKQLDGVLSNFVKSLADISVSTERTKNTVDHTIRVHQTVVTSITGSAEHPVLIYQPRTRIIYMHVDGSTWKWATNKASHEESTFNMQYAVVDFDLNANRWIAAKDQLEKVFKEITGATFAQYTKKRFPKLIDPTA